MSAPLSLSCLAWLFIRACLLCVLPAAALAVPGAPTALVALDAADGVHLSWEASAGEVPAGYRIYRVSRHEVPASAAVPAESAWQLHGATTATFWSQPALPIDHSYEYAVRAHDATGAEGPRSAPILFARQRFGFVLPWGDTTPSPAFDFRPSHDARVRLTASGARLLRAGQPVRFMGVNICAAAAFPEAAEAAVVAKRMAKFGINLVRFHQIDQLRPNGVFSNSVLTEFDASQMARLGGFIDALAAEGIYTNLNLHVSRSYLSLDPKPERQRFKGVAIFSHLAGGAANIRQQQLDYATRFLNHSIPGIGRLRDHPAVSIVEINNENGLIDQWARGNLDRLATEFPTYHGELRHLWTEWLRNRHADDDALRAAWSAHAIAAGTPAYGTQLLAGAPAPGSAIADPWELQVNTTTGAAATGAWVAGSAPEVDSPGAATALRIHVTQPSSNGTKHHVQLLRKSLALNTDVAHTLRFHGKVGAGEPDRPFRVVLRTPSGSVNYSIAELRLTSRWQEFTVCFPPAPVSSLNFSVTDFAAQTGHIYLSGFSLGVGNALVGRLASTAEPTGIDPANLLFTANNNGPFNFAATTATSWTMPSGDVAQRTHVPDGRAPGVDSLLFSVVPATVPTAGSALLFRTFGSGALLFGEPYQLRFDAKAPAGATFTANGQLHGGAFPVFGSATFTGTGDWQTCSITFTVSDATTTTRRIGFGLGLIDGDFELANIYVRRGGLAGLPEGESLAAEAFVEPITKNAFYSRFRSVQRDWLAFLWDTELDYWQTMRRHVRETIKTATGLPPILLLGTQGLMSPNLLQEAAGFDVIDDHGYWQHPTSFHAPWHTYNVPMTGEPDLGANTIAHRAGRRIVGKPYVISEYAHPAPNTYGTEGFPLFAAYGALQGWAGVLGFEYEHGRDSGGMTWRHGYEGWLTIARAPAKMVTLPAARAMLDRGHIASEHDGTPAHSASVTIIDATAQEMIRQMMKAAIGATDFGIAPELAYRAPIGMRRAPIVRPADSRTLPVLPTAPAGALESRDGSLRWETADARVLIRAARTKAAIGQLPADGALDLGHGVSLESTAPKLQGSARMTGPNRIAHPERNWACFVLTRTDALGDAPAGALGSRWLLTTTGYADNHFLRWIDTETTSQGPWDNTSSIRDFGRAPSLVERITGTISFPVAPGARLVAHELDIRGDFGTALQVSHQTVDGVRRATVSLPKRPETIWYSIEIVAAPLSPFAQWRIDNFATPETPEAAPDADPDSDGLPNLVEYALGIPPLEPSPAGERLAASIAVIDNAEHLVIAMRRRTDDPSLHCAAETSGDLLGWTADGVLLPGAIDHGDGTETVVFRDPAPLAPGARRFFRLRFWLEQ